MTPDEAGDLRNAPPSPVQVVQGSSKAFVVEVLGRYSNLLDQGELIRGLLNVVPKRSPEPFPAPPKRVIHRLSQAEIEAMVADYAAGIRIPDLVERFQVDQTTVQKYVRKAGLPRRSGRVTPNKIEEVISLYRTGRSVDWIAERLDVSDSTVRRTLVRAGVPIRRRGRPRRSAS